MYTHPMENVYETFIRNDGRRELHQQIIENRLFVDKM